MRSRQALRLAAVALAGLIPTVSALAQPRLDSLAAAWQAAEQADRVLAVEAVARDASQVKRAQARALWAPQVQAVAYAGAGGHTTAVDGAAFAAPGMPPSQDVAFDTSIRAGAAARVALQARKPLLSPERDVQATQLDLGIQADELQWRIARQQAMQRLTGHYLSLGLADARVRLLEDQLQRVTAAASEARERFQLGASPITDTHEAEAARAGVQAALAQARSEAVVAARALQDSTGRANGSARLPERAADDEAVGLPSWIEDARQRNPTLERLRLAIGIAQQDLRLHGRWSRLAVDLIAQAQRERLDGHGAFGNAHERAMQYGVGVQVTVPLLDAPLREAGRLGAEQQLRRREAERLLAEQQVESQVRAAWGQLAAERERTQALLAAVRAGEARLDATQTGRSLGERTTLEWLSAQNDLSRVRLEWRQSLVRQWQARLDLLALVDRLDVSALDALDRASQP